MQLRLAALFSACFIAALAWTSHLPGGAFWVVFGAFCGACAGSFLNVVAYRLPIMMQRAWVRDSREVLELPPEPEGALFNLALPRSRCPSCGHQIPWYENIPVLSYLHLRGRCSSCANPISMRYPLVEMFAGLITAVVFAVHGGTVQSVIVSGFVWVSLVIALIDADTFLIPDDLSLPLVWAGLLLSLFGFGPPLAAAVMGAAVGYGCLWAVNGAYKLLRGHDGMGAGDFKYLAACGAFLGAKPLAIVIIIAAGAAVLLTFGAALFKDQKVKGGTALPFGPYLAVGAVATLMLKAYLPAHLAA